MANDLTSTPHLWVVDTVGILSETPVWIQKIVYAPSANADDMQFKQWDEETTVSAGTKIQGLVGTITGTNTLTSTGNLPSSIADGHIFEIQYSSGTSDNVGKKLVETAGDANAVVIQEDDWTNEATKTYLWRTFATVPAIYLEGGASDTSPISVDFGPRGRWFPNLCLEVDDGGTAYVYLRQS